MSRPVSFRGFDGVRLAGDSWGDPGAPPVLLLHGGGQTRWAWGGTAQALAGAGFHAVALDARGHGESDWPADADYRLNAFVADLLAVAATFDALPAVVGASMGGITGLIAAGETDARVIDALVLVDAATKLEVVGVERIVGFMTAHQDGFATLEDARDAIAAYLPHRPPPSDLEGLAKNLRRGGDGRWRWHWDPQFIFGPKPPADAANVERLDAAAANLDLPTLLVRGRMSDVISLDIARHFLALAPHAEFVDVSGAGHMVAGDRNDAFTAAVVEFLTRVHA
jgi:pimeloyl-ACP methyl ester carboxylesterase